MLRWSIAGLTLALALACATSPADPGVPPPETPSADTPPAEAGPGGGRVRQGRKAPDRDGRRRGKARRPVEEPIEVPDPAPPSSGGGGGGGSSDVSAACRGACDHVVDCGIASFDECAAQCPKFSRDDLETAKGMSCAQLRAIIGEYR